nr:aminoglycoside phosphotransferase family protein [Streptomyces sp. RKAG290]
MERSAGETGGGRRVGQPDLPPRRRDDRTPPDGRRLRTRGGEGAPLAAASRARPAGRRAPVLALGAPGEGYPYPWSVRRWLRGETADPDRIDDLPRFAVSVAEFVLALQRCDTTGGPLAGEHSWYRGASPAHYDEETRRCLTALKGRVDTDRARVVWDAALCAEWCGEPVWFHGDIASGNLLVAHGELAAVIDFGTSGVGDPACDLVIAWGMFSGDSREAFRHAARQDDGTWARARGWALWKALLNLTGYADTDGERAANELRVIEAVLADHDKFA